MDKLRLILLILGVIVIVVMYLWYTLKDKKQQRQQFIPPSDPDADIADIKITARWSEEGDYSSTLSELSHHISEPEQGTAARENDSSSKPATMLTKEQQETFDFPEHATEEKQQAESSSANEEKAQDNIITLHITALPTKPFSGEALLDAAGLVGLVYGEMNIYHHFGVGDMRSQQPLFSLANMYEPGHFKLDTIEKESIKGVTSFICLPTVVDPLIVFELMLNTTQRLADILGGELRGPAHKLLSDKDIAALRNKITQFSA